MFEHIATKDYIEGIILKWQILSGSLFIFYLQVVILCMFDSNIQ